MAAGSSWFRSCKVRMLRLWRRKIRKARFREGYQEGYRQGKAAGRHQFGDIFEGTSIIIPTYNQLHLLKTCLDSVEKYTDLPYEAIVVDNASNDGTAAWLQALGGKVRFRVMDSNRGFAGAANAGLMMAKGRTIVLLNNEMPVRENWLGNMMHGLKSDPWAGMVGHSLSQPTDRLSGFCVLFRRELFESAGYLDEGFEIGNFEDHDYDIRVQLLGKSLVVARDSLIHRSGSVSIRAPGEGFHPLSARNGAWFMAKWDNPTEWIHRVRRHLAAHGEKVLHAGCFFPERIAVQSTGAMVYWIAGGRRRPVKGALSFPAVRVSQIDLRRWPAGDSIAAGDVENLWRGLDGEAGWQTGVVAMRDGTSYHVEGDTVRRIANDTALQAWNLHLKPLKTVSPLALAEKKNGLPIFAPPVLKQWL